MRLHRERVGEKELVLVFPWAGGNINAPGLRALAKSLLQRPSVVVYGVDLPGRITQPNTIPLRDFEQAVDEIIGAYVELLKTSAVGFERIVFVGFSLGSLLGWRTIQKLEMQSLSKVDLFICNACVAPSIAASRSYQYDKKTDQELIDIIVAKGGTPRNFFDTPGMRQMVLPAVRGDYAILDSLSSPQESPLLSCAIVHINGDQDDSCADENSIQLWEKYTSKTFHRHTVHGGHFFVQTDPGTVSQLILKELINASSPFSSHT